MPMRIEEVQEALEEVKKCIRATLISSPSPRMTIRNLAEQYRLLEGEEIPFQQFGRHSVYDFLLQLPDTVKLLDRSNQNSLVEAVTNEQTKHVARLVRCQKSPKKKRSRKINSRRPSVCIYPPISSCIMNSKTSSEKIVDTGPLTKHPNSNEISIALICRLVKLLRTNEHLRSGNLFREYEKLHGERLQSELFGFTSEEKFLQYLKSTFIVDAATDEIDSGLSSNVNSRGGTIHQPFPPEVCRGDFNFETDQSFEKLKKGDRFKVNLGEVFSLDKFYVTFLAKIKFLDEMMADLDEFYKNNEEKYKMQISLISSDLLCACPYSKNSRWHRARVVSHSQSLKSAKVMFIDYGTTEIVNIHKLRYLHKNFAKHPPFCMPATLSGIRPIVGKDYNDSANLEFLRLYGNRDLEAQVVCKTPHCLEIFLYASDGNCTTSVHQELISRNLVRPVHDKIMMQGTGPLSEIIDGVAARLTPASKSSFEASSKSSAPSTTLPSSMTSRRPSIPVSSSPKQAPFSAYIYYPNYTMGHLRHPFGPYTGTPLFVPNFPPRTFPFYPFQNPYYFPSCPLPPTLQFQPAGPLNSFRPPPGLSLPPMPAKSCSGSNVKNISPDARNSPSSRLSIDVTRATAYSRDHVESIFTTASGLPLISSASNVTNCDRTEKLDDTYVHRLGMNEEVISKRLEEFAISGEQIEDISPFEALNKCVPERETLKSELHDECVKERENRDYKRGPSSITLRERKAVEKKLKEYLDLHEDGGDEVDSDYSSTPTELSSPVKLNVLAREFIPKTLPKVNSTAVDTTNVLCAPSEALPSTKKYTAENLKQLRAFVLRNQAKM